MQQVCLKRTAYSYVSCQPNSCRHFVSLILDFVLKNSYCFDSDYLYFVQILIVLYEPGIRI